MDSYPIASDKQSLSSARARLSLLAVVLLTACTHHTAQSKVEAESTRPTLSIEGGQIRASRDVLLFESGPNLAPVEIRWSIDTASGFRFTERGIVIEGRIQDELIRGDRLSVVLDSQQDEVVDCKPIDKGAAFSCSNRRTKPGIYKYTIELTNGQKTITLDPSLTNW